MADKMVLYKAVKHEVEVYPEDHGYTLPELWHEVTKGENATFWAKVVLDNYRKEVLHG